MVQKAVTFVDQVSVSSDLDKKLELIDTLRTITEGKVISYLYEFTRHCTHCTLLVFIIVRFTLRMSVRV